MTTYFAATVPSPIGPLSCFVDETGAVVGIDLPASRHPERSMAARLAARGARVEQGRGEAVRAVTTQLREYFAGKRRAFELRLAPDGTSFQRAVWQALERIPFGETRSYGDIATELGRPEAVRAVGAANGANPIPIVVPCHRVIGRDGSLTGFGGGLAAKEWLLRHEGAAFQVGLPFAARA